MKAEIYPKCHLSSPVVFSLWAWDSERPGGTAVGGGSMATSSIGCLLNDVSHNMYHSIVLLKRVGAIMI